MDRKDLSTAVHVLFTSYITPWRSASVLYDTPIKATRQQHTTVDDQFHMVLLLQQ